MQTGCGDDSEGEANLADAFLTAEEIPGEWRQENVADNDLPACLPVEPMPKTFMQTTFSGSDTGFSFGQTIAVYESDHIEKAMEQVDDAYDTCIAVNIGIAPQVKPFAKLGDEVRAFVVPNRSIQGGVELKAVYLQVGCVLTMVGAGGMSDTDLTETTRRALRKVTGLVEEAC